MLHIHRDIGIPEREIETSAVRASGPGGQNVNKVASAIHLRFDVMSSSLPADCKQRLLELRDRRISRAGVIVIKAQRYRDQEKNHRDARERLVALVRKALARPAPRKPTRPTRASRRRRLEQKTRRGQLKTLRGRVHDTD
jgi:ribosome-associated protein